MPLLARASVRQTTCHPPRALPFGIIPTRPSCFYFHHPIPVCKVWNGFSRKRMSHCAGLGASVQVSGQKLWRFRGIYQQADLMKGTGDQRQSERFAHSQQGTTCPTAYHRQNLALSSPHSDHRPHGTHYPRFSRKCLIENGCLDLFEVCRLHRLLSFH
jgi:hypothetical protein